MHPQTARAVQSWIFCLLALGTLVCPASLRADDDAVLFTLAGFSRAGQATLKPPANAGKLKVTVRDARTGAATFCRVNVVGSDGNFYYPKQNYLTPYALAGRWPKTGLGNREGKAPIRYLGRFFYSWGDFEIDLPPGAARVEVWKGLEYRPEVASTTIATGQDKSLEIKLTNETRPGDRRHTRPAIRICTFAGKPTPTIRRFSTCWRRRISASAASWPTTSRPGRTRESWRRWPRRSFADWEPRPIRDRGRLSHRFRAGISQPTYGHLNLYFRNDLVLGNKHVNANNGPLYGLLARETRDKGGFAFYCHGGYAQTIPTRRFTPTPSRGTSTASSCCSSASIARWDWRIGIGC